MGVQVKPNNENQKTICRAASSSVALPQQAGFTAAAVPASTVKPMRTIEQLNNDFLLDDVKILWTGQTVQVWNNALTKGPHRFDGGRQHRVQGDSVAGQEQLSLLADRQWQNQPVNL